MADTKPNTANVIDFRAAARAIKRKRRALAQERRAPSAAEFYARRADVRLKAHAAL